MMWWIVKWCKDVVLGIALVFFAEMLPSGSLSEMIGTDPKLLQKIKFRAALRQNSIQHTEAGFLVQDTWRRSSSVFFRRISRL